MALLELWRSEKGAVMEGASGWRWRVEADCGAYAFVKSSRIGISVGGLEGRWDRGGGIRRL